MPVRKAKIKLKKDGIMSKKVSHNYNVLLVDKGIYRTSCGAPKTVLFPMWGMTYPKCKRCLAIEAKEG